MGKSKEISQDLRKKIVDLHKSGSSLGAISKHLKVPRSSVQTIVCKYKHHGTTQSSYRSGRRCILSPRDERTLVRKVKINPRTTAKDLVKMLEETGTKVSISTVKRVLNRHNLIGRSARKKPLLQNHHKKARLRFATAHGDKDRTFWRNVLCSDETKIKLFGHNDHRYVWRKKGEACKPKNTIPTVKHGGGSIMSWGVLFCRRDWCTSQNKWHHEEGKLCGCIEATSQDISQEVKAWSQMGFPNGQCPQAYFQSCGKMA
uniref:Transposase Tc1-like domain-containing protein n=1 Tax=Oncorhynchus tshawytscha TaxID=74940 RepID=A0AAZ3PMV5_ONCTS